MGALCRQIVKTHFTLEKDGSLLLRKMVVSIETSTVSETFGSVKRTFVLLCTDIDCPLLLSFYKTPQCNTIPPKRLHRLYMCVKRVLYILQCQMLLTCVSEKKYGVAN